MLQLLSSVFAHLLVSETHISHRALCTQVSGMASLAASSTTVSQETLSNLRKALPCKCEKCTILVAQTPLGTFESCGEDMLARFFLGSKGDHDKAVHILTGSLCWRHAMKVDEALTDPTAPERALKLQAVLPYSSSHRDANGNAMYVEMTGFCDVDGMLQVGEAEFLKNHVAVNEFCTQNNGRRWVILDLNGLELGMLGSSGMSLLKKMIDMDQRHYPESLHRCYIVNAPLIITTAFAMVKPWLDPVTLAKITILGENFHETLRQDIGNADGIPRHLGGKCQCPWGCVKVQPSLRRGEVPIVDETKVTALAGEKKQVRLVIAHATEVAFVFRTVGFPLTFNLTFFAAKEEDMDKNFNREFNLGKNIPVSGKFQVESKSGGFVVIMLDNREAWMYSIMLFCEFRDAATGVLLETMIE